ncbi:lantibiotic dehydratase [Streptomyces sp. NPDC059743]|uniref:lantibiotic dehydratase n=1 Tax=Streptomyces sp. NPDC059743 TaxID=3346928 RepID=UPI0036636D2B
MYSTIDAALLLRASAHPIAEKLPPWPDLDSVTSEDVDRWRSWIEQVWAINDLAAAIETASPPLTVALNKVLSRGTDQPREVRRAVVSLVRYLLRMQQRATPFTNHHGTWWARWVTENAAVPRGSAVRSWCYGTPVWPAPSSWPASPWATSRDSAWPNGLFSTVWPTPFSSTTRPDTAFATASAG